MTTAAYGPLAAPSDEASDRYCLGCGYNLRGLAPGKCPECGRVSDGREDAGLRLPWLQRRRTGTFEAYWRTAWLVTFRPAEFAARFHWPQVRHHGSPSFRTWTVGYAVAGVMIAAAAGAWDGRYSLRAMAVLLGALLPSTVAFFWGATELAGYFAGPRPMSDTSEEGFRAGVINDYASAALAWTPLPALLMAAGAAASRAIGDDAGALLFAMAALVYASIAVFWLFDVLVAFGHALSLGPAGLTLAAIFFPVRCAGLAVLTAVFVFLPLVCCVGGAISIRF